MRLDRVDGKRKLTFATREKQNFGEVLGLCQDLTDINIEGAEEAAEKLEALMRTVDIPVPGDEQEAEEPTDPPAE